MAKAKISESNCLEEFEESEGGKDFELTLFNL